MFSTQLIKQSRHFFLIAFGLASVISSTVWGEECLPLNFSLKNSKSVQGRICDTGANYIFLPDCVFDENKEVRNSPSCNRHNLVFNKSDPKQYINGNLYWKLAENQGMSSRNSNRFAADNCSQGQAVGYQNKWVTYQCEPENAFYSDKTQNFYNPLISVLFNVEPVYHIGEYGKITRSNAIPISMSGSIQKRVTDNVAIQTCTNNLVTRESNPKFSADFRTVTLYFDGSHQWKCHVQTGFNNLGESRLKLFNENYLRSLEAKSNANRFYK